MAACVFNPSTQKQRQTDVLYSNFQAKKGYIVRTCLKAKEKKRRRIKEEENMKSDFFFKNLPSGVPGEVL